MGRVTGLLLVLLLSLLTPACVQIDVEPFTIVDESEPPQPEFVSLHIEGLDFEDFNGYTVFASLSDMTDRGDSMPGMVTRGTFLVILEGLRSDTLEVETLDMFLFMDADGDGACGPTDSDIFVTADITLGDPSIALVFNEAIGAPPMPCLPEEPPPEM